MVGLLGDVERIKNTYGCSEADGSALELGFQVMSALHKYFQHERFHLEVNLGNRSFTRHIHDFTITKI